MKDEFVEDVSDCGISHTELKTADQQRISQTFVRTYILVYVIQYMFREATVKAIAMHYSKPEVAH